jgi:hypothetical protein
MYAFERVAPDDKTFPPVPVDVVVPVPPCATGRVPTMLVTAIFPEMFDALILLAVTVPIIVGFERVGVEDRTLKPVPVIATAPVPPWITGRVPTTPPIGILVIPEPFPDKFDALMLLAVIVPIKIGLERVGVDERTLRPVPDIATAPVPPRVVGRGTVSVAALATVPTILAAAILVIPEPFPDTFDATILLALINPINTGFDKVGVDARTTFPVPVDVVTPVPP